MKNKFYCTDNVLNIYESPHHKSKISSQLLYGEHFRIISKTKKYFKIKTSFDNYLGYIIKKNYIKKFIPTHKIFKLSTQIFKKPLERKKYQTNLSLSFASKISIISQDGPFAQYAKNKWIKRKDIKKVSYKDDNFVKMLKIFIETKYTWGGKSYKGMDCSAILQLFFYYNNRFFPRDTKDQIRYLKKDKTNKYTKGDIIFWKGHVAICIDSKNLIHAYGPKKKVLIMPINYTIKNIEKTSNLKVQKVSNIKL